MLQWRARGTKWNIFGVDDKMEKQKTLKKKTTTKILWSVNNKNYNKNIAAAPTF